MTSIRLHCPVQSIRQLPELHPPGNGLYWSPTNTSEMSVQFDFTNRVAVVTGAAGSLGSAVTNRFRTAGADVVGIDVAAPPASDPATDYRQADLTDPSTTDAVFDEIIAEYGRIDYLLTAAGMWRGGQPLAETPVDEFDSLMAVNLKTLFLAAKHALPHLRDTNGAIVGVSARSALQGGTGDGPYRASKAGVRLLIETIAEENLGTVRANAVLPSVIDTPANREMMPDSDHDAWVDPEEIATVMAFLCSDGAAPTSGAAVPVYGEA